MNEKFTYALQLHRLFLFYDLYIFILIFKFDYVILGFWEEDRFNFECVFQQLCNFWFWDHKVWEEHHWFLWWWNAYIWYAFFISLINLPSNRAGRVHWCFKADVQFWYFFLQLFLQNHSPFLGILVWWWVMIFNYENRSRICIIKNSWSYNHFSNASILRLPSRSFVFKNCS